MTAHLLPVLLVLSLLAPAAHPLAGGGAQSPQTPDTATPESLPDTMPEEGEPQEVTGERAELDRAAEETLQALLDRLQGLEGVTVTVEAGLARLEGTVPSAEARERAEQVAREVEGVGFVDNRIELSTSVTEQLGPAVDRLRGRLADLLALLPALGVAVVALVLAAILAGWLGGLVAPYGLVTANPFVQNVLRQAVRAVVVFAGVLVAVEVLDITALVGAVVGTAGVAGLALGFAFKDIVENYLAGLLLSLRQPFAPRDTVEVEGRHGKVLRLTARETILMDLDGNHVRIPNATVFRSVMTNFTRNPRRRFEVVLTVGPEEELSRAMELGLRTLHGMEGVLDDPPPAARVEEVGDSRVVLAWNGWMDQQRSDFLKVRSEAIRLILADLADAGVRMPPPEHRVRVVEGGEPSPAPVTSRSEADSGTPEPDEVQKDVSVDRSLDEQIDEERRRSGEEDYLE